MKDSMKLYFYRENGQYTLDQTVFSHRILRGAQQKALRGNAMRSAEPCGTFKWTPAVRAVAVLLLKSVHNRLEGGRDRVFIYGGRASLAQSLDYAISKETGWLADMFGTSSSGKLLAKRLIRRVNSGRKRPGPVEVSLNESFLSADNIEVFVQREQVASKSLLEEMFVSMEDPVTSALSRDTSEMECTQSGCLLRQGRSVQSDQPVTTSELARHFALLSVELKNEIRSIVSGLAEGVGVAELVDDECCLDSY